MSADRFAEVERLYHEASLRPPAERAAFLDQACGGDEALRHEVESLLSLDTDADGFLSRPALEEAARTSDRPGDPHSWPTIPGYTVRRVLGEGGMGVVYLAEQETPLRRLVALKLIKPGMDTRQVVARFETERQALALMDHPNIAAVFDAGSTDDGRPYFIMEFVDGPPITAYCDEHRLSTNERLELFQRVCAAVQHAHQKGVIHRDLKPSNVLVTEQEGRALPKVIDFGTAKATGGDWNATATEGGQGMVLGTLEYMSPEQAALSADIDTATDVYSLGVLLYELLVGRLPFDTDELRAAGYDEIRRVIRESDPPKPSVRVEQRSEKSGPAARARQTDAPGLTRQLRGDLDWITLKALEKDRTRRYATVAAFATDIGRFLDDQPVDARPPSSTYRIRKFTRRHRGAVAATVSLFVVLVAGLAASRWQYLHAEDARIEAQRERVEAIRQSCLVHIASAAESLDRHQPGEVKRLLANCDPALRNWEWRYLSSEADSSSAVLKANVIGSAPVGNAFFSPNGTSVLAGTRGSGHPVVVWDRSTGQQRESVLEDGLEVVAASAGGEQVLLRSRRDVSLSVWDTSSGSITSLPPLAPSHPWAWAIRADAKAVAVSDSGPRRLIHLTGPEMMSIGGRGPFTVLVSDISSGKLGRRFAGHKNAIVTLAFTPDGAYLISGSADRTARIWNVKSGSVQSVLRGHEGTVTSAAFSSDGHRVATGSTDKTVRVWDVASGTLLRVMAGHDRSVSSVRFSPDGRRVVSGSDDATVRVWDSASGRELRCLNGHETRITSVAFSPRGDQIVSSSSDGTVRIWDTQTSPTLESIVDHSGVAGLRFSADGTVVAVSRNGGLEVWNTATGRMATIGRVPTSPTGQTQNLPWVSTATFPALSRDGSKLLGNYYSDDTTQLWNVSSGQMLGSVPGGWVSALRPDASQIATVGTARTAASGTTSRMTNVELWDANSLKRVLVLENHSEVDTLAYSPDGLTLAAGTRDSAVSRSGVVINLWDTRSGELLRVLRGHRNTVVSLAFSADGRQLASVDKDGTGRVWDASSGELNAELRHSPVESIAFSPDASRIVTANRDATVRVWDARTGDQLLILSCKGNLQSGAAFTPDGKQIVSWTSTGDGGRPGHVWAAR